MLETALDTNFHGCADPGNSTPLSVSSRSPWEQQQHQLHPQLQQQQQQKQGLPVHSNGVLLPGKPSLWSCLDNSGDVSANRWALCGLCGWWSVRPAAMQKLGALDV